MVMVGLQFEGTKVCRLITQHGAVFPNSKTIHNKNREKAKTNMSNSLFRSRTSVISPQSSLTLSIILS